MAKITIDIGNVKTEVKGGLAMMGKRLPTKNGGHYIQALLFQV